MARSQTPRGIGRGEVADGQIEAPIFMLLMAVAAVVISGIHLYYQNFSLTIAVSARSGSNSERPSLHNASRSRAALTPASPMT